MSVWMENPTIYIVYQIVEVPEWGAGDVLHQNNLRFDHGYSFVYLFIYFKSSKVYYLLLREIFDYQSEDQRFWLKVDSVAAPFPTSKLILLMT